tara:strand:- start:2218 stop:2580 length:363 start_codon:yes stop_codon:yes gene_type:complete
MMEDQDEGEAMTAASGYGNDGNWVGDGAEMSPEDRMAVDAMNYERTPPVIEPIGEIPPGIPDGMSPEERMAFDAMNTEGTPPITTPMLGMTPPEVSVINPKEEDERMEMMKQLLLNQYAR